MREAVIVSTARTPIGRAYRGAFNNTPSPTLAGHALTAAVARAGVAPEEIEDCLLGCSLPQGVQQTIGRMAALRAGFPATVPGMTLDRQCSSGLMTIATAAKQVMVDRMDVIVAGGSRSHGSRRQRCGSTRIWNSWRFVPTPTCRCWTPPRWSPLATASPVRTVISPPWPHSIAPPPPRPRDALTPRSSR